MTRHRHVDEFLADYCRVTGRNTLILPATELPPLRSEVDLRVELESGIVVLSGRGRVEQIYWRNGKNAVKVRVLALDSLSRKLFRRLLARARDSTEIKATIETSRETAIVPVAG